MKRKIAVLTSGDKNNTVYDILNKLQKAAQDSSIDLYVFCAFKYKERTGLSNTTGFHIFDLINYSEYSGIVIFSNFIDDDSVLEQQRIRILNSRRPAISIGKRLQGLSFVHLDNIPGYFRLIEHLINDHKLRKFVFIGGNKNDTEALERTQAFKAATSKHTIPMFASNLYLDGDGSYDFGYNTAISIFEKPQTEWPQAIICATDTLALACLKAANLKGIKIPDQIKIIGFDDIPMAKSVIPSLSTVHKNNESIAAEILKKVISGTTNEQEIKVYSKPVIRQSCGCNTGISADQINFALQNAFELESNSKFEQNLRQLETIFQESSDTYNLINNLGLFFFKNHQTVGENFSIFLNSNWTSILINSEEELGENYSFGKQVQSIVDIKDGQKNISEIISLESLVPETTKAAIKQDTFLFLPIYNHNYIHGYYVQKNNFSMLYNRHGLDFTKTLGNSIESFRKKNMYKLMSQQFFKLSTTDGLSGLKNRVALEKLAKPYYENNKKKNLYNILVFVDINKMKHINDNFGHLHGDLAVKTVADSISTVIPKGWMGIRYGGDEFVIVGNNINYNGEDYGEKIVQTLKAKTTTMKLPYELSVSVGSAMFEPTTPLTLQQAIDKVDEIMYEKKVAFHKAMGDYETKH